MLLFFRVNGKILIDKASTAENIRVEEKMNDKEVKCEPCVAASLKKSKGKNTKSS